MPRPDGKPPLPGPLPRGERESTFRMHRALQVWLWNTSFPRSRVGTHRRWVQIAHSAVCIPTQSVGTRCTACSRRRVIRASPLPSRERDRERGGITCERSEHRDSKRMTEKSKLLIASNEQLNSNWRRCRWQVASCEYGNPGLSHRVGVVPSRHDRLELRGRAYSHVSGRSMGR